jgi:DNA-binding beta-propeller fold protein YncE
VQNLLFVTCMEDKLTFPGNRGSVYVIDLNSKSVKTRLYTGHQPHGIAIDRARGIVAVTNRNFSSDGPAPHHTTACGGRNGNVSFIDLRKLEFIRGSSVEVSVDPYFISIKP